MKTNESLMIVVALCAMVANSQTLSAQTQASPTQSDSCDFFENQTPTGVLRQLAALKRDNPKSLPDSISLFPAKEDWLNYCCRVPLSRQRVFGWSV